MAALLRNPRHMHAICFWGHALWKTQRRRQSRCLSRWRKRKAGAVVAGEVLRLFRHHAIVACAQRCLATWRHSCQVIHLSMQLILRQWQSAKMLRMATRSHVDTTRVTALRQVARVLQAANLTAVRALMALIVRTWRDGTVSNQLSEMNRQLSDARREIVCLSNQIRQQSRGVKTLEMMYSLPAAEASIVLLIVEKLKGSKHHTSANDWDSILATLKGREAAHNCPIHVEESVAEDSEPSADDLDYRWAHHRCTSMKDSTEKVIYDALRRALMAYAFNLFCRRLGKAHYVYEEKYLSKLSMTKETEFEAAERKAATLMAEKRKVVRDLAFESVSHEMPQDDAIRLLKEHIRAQHRYVVD